MNVRLFLLIAALVVVGPFVWTSCSPAEAQGLAVGGALSIARIVDDTPYLGKTCSLLQPLAFYNPVQNHFLLCAAASGQNINVSQNGTWVSFSAGAANGGVWGSITGLLSSQVDLAAALGLKADTTALALKADTAALGLKADATALVSGLALKADASALTSGLALKADASALTSGLATKQPLGAYLTANQPITLSGDATGAGTTSIVVALPTVNSSAGTYGDATHSVTIQVNGKGQVLGVSQNPIASGGTFYQTLQANGTPVTQRTSVNFVAGSGITITPTDNSGTNTTTITLASTGGGGGISFGPLASRPACNSGSNGVVYAATDTSQAIIGPQLSLCSQATGSYQWNPLGPSVGTSGNLSYDAGGNLDTSANVLTAANSQTVTGLKTFSQGTIDTPVLVSALRTCNSGANGSRQTVTDSTTQTWGATVTGGGSLPAGVYCDGLSWTIYAK